MSKETIQFLNDFGKIIIPALIASIPGLVALYIAIRKTPHEEQKIDADAAVAYIGTAKTAEELVGMKDIRIKQLETRIHELELENERQRKEIRALKEALEKYCNGDSGTQEVKPKPKKRSS
jgi:hypothetical protein